MDQNGKLLQTDRICWSEAPIAVIIQKPYAIALLPRRVEVVWLNGSSFSLIWWKFGIYAFLLFSFTGSISSSSVCFDTDNCSPKCPASYSKQQCCYCCIRKFYFWALPCPSWRTGILVLLIRSMLCIDRHRICKSKLDWYKISCELRIILFIVL